MWKGGEGEKEGVSRESTPRESIEGEERKRESDREREGEGEREGGRGRRKGRREGERRRLQKIQCTTYLFEH